MCMGNLKEVGGGVRKMWNRCDHIVLRAGYYQECGAWGMKTMLAPSPSLVEVSSSLGTVLERKDAPCLWPQVNQVQSGGKSTPLLLPRPFLQ